jgi:hypothetical protein
MDFQVIAFQDASSAAFFMHTFSPGNDLTIDGIGEGSMFLLIRSFSWMDSRNGPRPSHWRGFEITLRHATLGRTPLDE